MIGANVKVVDSTEGTITDSGWQFLLDGYSECPFIHIVYRLCHTGSGGERSTSSQCNFERRYPVNRRSSSCWLRRTKESEPAGAVSSVKMDDVLGDRPVVSVSDALKGAMPGLQITGNSGRPGEEMSFNIRGVNSLDKNGKPLVLVDNVEMDI